MVYHEYINHNYITQILMVLWYINQLEPADSGGFVLQAACALHGIDGDWVRKIPSGFFPAGTGRIDQPWDMMGIETCNGICI